MRPKVELLKNHGQVRADAHHLRRIRRAAGGASARPSDRVALEQDIALLAVRQLVGEWQDGGFAGPRRSDKRNHIAAPGGDGHTFDHLKRTIGLVQIAEFDERGDRRLGGGVLGKANLCSLSCACGLKLRCGGIWHCQICRLGHLHQTMQGQSVALRRGKGGDACL